MDQLRLTELGCVDRTNKGARGSQGTAVWQQNASTHTCHRIGSGGPRALVWQDRTQHSRVLAEAQRVEAEVANHRTCRGRHPWSRDLCQPFPASRASKALAPTVEIVGGVRSRQPLGLSVVVRILRELHDVVEADRGHVERILLVHRAAHDGRATSRACGIGLNTQANQAPNPTKSVSLLCSTGYDCPEGVAPACE
jgi:hypothetical protein